VDEGVDRWTGMDDDLHLRDRVDSIWRPSRSFWSMIIKVEILAASNCSVPGYTCKERTGHIYLFIMDDSGSRSKSPELLIQLTAGWLLGRNSLLRGVGGEFLILVLI